MTLDIQNHLDSQSNASELSPTASVYPPKRRKINSTSAVSRGVATLTPEQLAKKRANDREAQRAIRERTKTQIETLETKIRELTSQQPYQELQVALRQKQAVQAENEEIRKRLSSILAIIQPILGAQGLTGKCSRRVLCSYGLAHITRPQILRLPQRPIPVRLRPNLSLLTTRQKYPPLRQGMTQVDNRIPNAPLKASGICPQQR